MSTNFDSPHAEKIAIDISQMCQVAMGAPDRDTMVEYFRTIKDHADYAAMDKSRVDAARALGTFVLFTELPSVVSRADYIVYQVNAIGGAKDWLSRNYPDACEKIKGKTPL